MTKDKIGLEKSQIPTAPKPPDHSAVSKMISPFPNLPLTSVMLLTAPKFTGLLENCANALS